MFEDAGFGSVFEGSNLFSGGSLFGGGLGGDAAPANSSSDAIFSTNLGFDNSGFNVTFGSNAGISAPVDKQANQGSDAAGGSGRQSSLNDYLPYAILFVGALIAFKAFKK